jgi:hypothetical protein
LALSVIQEELAEAFQPHGLVMLILKAPPAGGTAWLLGVNVVAGQGSPSWVTLNVVPATEIVPVRVT